MKKMPFAYFSLLAGVFVYVTNAQAVQLMQPEILTGPVSERYKTQLYARNIWDMKVFDGRLYLGTGNSSNEGPDSNAGPVPVWSMNLNSGQWKTEFTVDEEQINIFRVLNGKLTIPGHDPRDDWTKGNFYQLDASGWKKTRTIPNGIHNYDMALFAGRMWAGLGTEGDNQLASSADGGQSWKAYPGTSGRTYTLQIFENVMLGWGYIASAKLSASIKALTDEKQRSALQANEGRSICEVASDGTFTLRPDLTGDVLMPYAPRKDMFCKVERPAVFRGELLYVGTTASNDHQADPFGLYAAESLRPSKARVRRIWLNGEKPWDIEVQGNTAHALTGQKIPRAGQPDEFQISVWSSSDAKKWKRTVRFTYTTFARSFAQSGDNWYFGMGTDVGESWDKEGPVRTYTRDLRREAGTILRVRMTR